jgi:hypothetical protein
LTTFHIMLASRGIGEPRRKGGCPNCVQAVHFCPFYPIWPNVECISY